MNDAFREMPEIDSEKRFENNLEEMRSRLLDIAKELIAKHQDLSKENNAQFLKEPDSVLAHEPTWHQWGIVTHTSVFEHVYQNEIPVYLEKWGMTSLASSLGVKIDGVSKHTLLKAAVLFHDLGKFTGRSVLDDKASPPANSFQGHERASGEVIRSSQFRMWLDSLSLSPNQIEYIASSAELHYELGLVRDEAKRGKGYDIAFSNSALFREHANRLIELHPNYALEIGILFLGDSLAKTDIRTMAETDEAVLAQRPMFEAEIQRRNLERKLIKAVLQLPVNVAVARMYLRILSERSAGS